MEKFVKLILCATLVVFGVVATLVEVHHVMSQAMTDEQWVGEILLMFIYSGVACFGVFRAINLWRKE